MTFLSLAELRALIEARAARIEAPPEALPTYGTSDGLATPHVEVHGRAGTATAAVLQRVRAALVHWGAGASRWARGYHLVVAERGREYSRRATVDLDEFLYWALAEVAHATAVERGRRSAVPAAERVRWEYTEWARLMGVLDPRWAVRWREEQAAVLDRLELPLSAPGPLGPFG